MSHTLIRFFYDYEKEERWLNKMSAQGKALSSYFWVKYTFEDEEPGKYIYKIEFLDNSGKNDVHNRQYFDFLNDMGVECVSVYMHWAILRKKAEDGKFEIYTDLDSKIKVNRKMWTWWRGIAVLEVLITCYLCYNYLFLLPTRTVLETAELLLIMMFDSVLIRLAYKARKRMKRFMKDKEIYEA